MNADTQEAALGLLGLAPAAAHIPGSISLASPNTAAASTSAAPPAPVIPAKRKQNPSTPTIPSPNLPPPTPTRTISAQKENLKDPDVRNKDKDASDGFDCLCGMTHDDGFSIQCDRCKRWCHISCFNINPAAIPDTFLCWICTKMDGVELRTAKQRAVKVQREALALARATNADRRSPGVEKRRRGVADGAPPGRRRRRPSIVHPPPSTATPTTSTAPLGPVQTPEEEHIEIEEPWTLGYVHTDQDLYANDDTRGQLTRYAQDWRGVTVVEVEGEDQSSLTSIKELQTPPSLSTCSHPDVLPPTYGLHTTAPVPAERLITTYRSYITPTSRYLSDPLNAYAYLGVPKPFVHLLGPPLNVALDARMTGNLSRFTRNGCKPNAVLRPVLCKTAKDEDLAFGVFALRDLKAEEEIVLGWEWDDGNVIHQLPAVLSSPDAFSFPPASIDHSQPQMAKLKAKMATLFHALASTFTTCACGAKARDCVLTQLNAFVDSSAPNAADQDIDLGPLVGTSRGFRTREKVQGSGGIGGMELLPPPIPTYHIASNGGYAPRSRKGKERERDEPLEVMSNKRQRSGEATYSSFPASTAPRHVVPSQTKSPLSSELRPPDPSKSQSINLKEMLDDMSHKESMMPAKMRRLLRREIVVESEGGQRPRRPSAGEVEIVKPRVGLGIQFAEESMVVDGPGDQSKTGPISTPHLPPASLTPKPNTTSSPSADFAKLNIGTSKSAPKSSFLRSQLPAITLVSGPHTPVSPVTIDPDGDSEMTPPSPPQQRDSISSPPSPAMSSGLSEAPDDDQRPPTRSATPSAPKVTTPWQPNDIKHAVQEPSTQEAPAANEHENDETEDEAPYSPAFPASPLSADGDAEEEKPSGFSIIGSEPVDTSVGHGHPNAQHASPSPAPTPLLETPPANHSSAHSPVDGKDGVDATLFESTSAGNPSMVPEVHEHAASPTPDPPAVVSVSGLVAHQPSPAPSASPGPQVSSTAKVKLTLKDWKKRRQEKAKEEAGAPKPHDSERAATTATPEVEDPTPKLNGVHRVKSEDVDMSSAAPESVGWPNGFHQLRDDSPTSVPCSPPLTTSPTLTALPPTASSLWNSKPLDGPTRVAPQRNHKMSMNHLVGPQDDHPSPTFTFSRIAKQEAIETLSPPADQPRSEPLPSSPTVPPTAPPPSSAASNATSAVPPPPTTSSTSSTRFAPRSPSPMGPTFRASSPIAPLSGHRHTRMTSEEDGEIVGSSSPPRPLINPSPPPSAPSSSSSYSRPRADFARHVEPTYPSIPSRPRSPSTHTLNHARGRAIPMRPQDTITAAAISSLPPRPSPYEPDSTMPHRSLGPIAPRSASNGPVAQKPEPSPAPYAMSKPSIQHSPPTQPRSMTGPNPMYRSTGSPTTNFQPPIGNSVTGTARVPPSAPRALRRYMGNGTSGPPATPSTVAPTSVSQLNTSGLGGTGAMSGAGGMGSLSGMANGGPDMGHGVFVPRGPASASRERFDDRYRRRGGPGGAGWSR